MNEEKVVNFLFEIASLRRLTRNHCQVIEDASDNISDHSFRVAIIGMILASLEKCDSNKVLRMCLFHDVAEARIGDLNYINKLYVKTDERQAREDQMDGLLIKEEVMDILDEYEERKSQESIVAKDADIIDQMILQQEYFYKDKDNQKIWHDEKELKLQTDSAKILAKRIRESNPLEWVYEMTQKNK